MIKLTLGSQNIHHLSVPFLFFFVCPNSLEEKRKEKHRQKESD